MAPNAPRRLSLPLGLAPRLRLLAKKLTAPLNRSHIENQDPDLPRSESRSRSAPSLRNSARGNSARHSANSGHLTGSVERAFLVGIDYQPRRRSVPSQA